MRFDPKSKDELKRDMLLPAGDYDFTVTEAEEKESAKGNPMIAVKLTVYTPDGSERTVRDWIMQGTVKLHDFCASTDLSRQYEAGELTDADCVGRSGRATLIIEDAKGQYGPANRVREYLEPAQPKAATQPCPTAARPMPKTATPPQTSRAPVTRPTGAAPVNTGPHQPVTEDDIPFTPTPRHGA
jgi:hypothetical protein